jgi:mono/diheme cytochrome c family protein
MRAGWMVTPWLIALLTAGGSLSGTDSAAQDPPPAPRVTPIDYDMRKAVTPPSLSEDELNGKKLFVQRCALCHDLLGQPATATVGPWVDAETVKSRGEARVREQILKGSRRMPGWQYTLDARQVDQMIAYLKTVSPDMKPKPRGAVTVPID